MKTPIDHHHHNLHHHHNHHHHHQSHQQTQIRKKRVGKACDSCRLKKTKCNGKNPCERCSLDNKPCVFTEKKKQSERLFTSEHVDLIEHRLKICNHSLLKLANWIKHGNKQELDRFAQSLNPNPDITSFEINDQSGEDAHGNNGYENDNENENENENDNDNDNDDDDNDYGINVNDIISLLQTNNINDDQTDKVHSDPISSREVSFKPNDYIKDQIYSPISLSPNPNDLGDVILPNFKNDENDKVNYFIKNDDLNLFGLNPPAERNHIDEIFDNDNNLFLNSSSSSFSYFPSNSNSSTTKLLNTIQ